MFALNLDSNNRILSVCKVLPKCDYKNMPIVKDIPSGNINEYIYMNNEFVYEPKSEKESQVSAQLVLQQLLDKNNKTPSQLDIIEAQVTYTAMMTDTLLEV